MLTIKQHGLRIVLPPRIVALFPNAFADLKNYYRCVDDEDRCKLRVSGDVLEFSFYYMLDATPVIEMYLWWEMHSESCFFNDPIIPEVPENEITWFFYITIPDDMSNR